MVHPQLADCEWATAGVAGVAGVDGAPGHARHVGQVGQLGQLGMAGANHLEPSPVAMNSARCGLTRELTEGMKGETHDESYEI